MDWDRITLSFIGRIFRFNCFITILMISTLTQSLKNDEDNFIINLINQDQFSECSLFIFQDRFDNDASVSRILVSFSGFSGTVSKSTYSVKYSFSSSTEIENVPNSRENSSIENDVLPVRFKPNIANYRKKSSNCLVVILFINDVRPEFIAQIYKMLTPVYIPITRKDEDFYIFKTKPESHKRLLMMRELPARIKFKIAVGSKESSKGESESDAKVVVNTVCFFCGRKAKPKLAKLSVGEDGFPNKTVNYFQDFVRDLNGRVLKATIGHVQAKIEADPPYKGVNNAKRGNIKKLLEVYLNLKFNFTYNMFLSSGINATHGRGGTGTLLDNGTWIGTAGDLIKGKADIGFVTTGTPKRVFAIDFTNYFDIGYLTFVTGQPQRIYSPLALLWPFELDMWMATLASIFISVIFMYGTFKVMNTLHIGTGEKWSFSRQVEFVIATALDQDSPVLPESQPLRCFVALWFFFMVILTNIYRCKMVTLLAFPVLGKLPTTFDELALPDYEVGFMRHGDSAINTLRASTDPVYVTLVEKMEIFSGVGLECLEKVVENHRYACIGYEFSMRHLRERNLSEVDTRNLVFAPARTYNIWMGISLEGKSILKQNFGKYISICRAFYLPEVWEKQDMYDNVRLLKLNWWKSTGQTDKMKHLEKESEDLTLKHFIGAFYVLGACLGISAAIFIQEIVADLKWRKLRWTCIAWLNRFRIGITIFVDKFHK